MSSAKKVPTKFVDHARDSAEYIRFAAVRFVPLCGRPTRMAYYSLESRIVSKVQDKVKTGTCEKKMVGTTGFEPATSRTPSVRATRLRYVPTGHSDYHSDSRTVNKERSESRRSSSILRSKAKP